MQPGRMGDDWIWTDRKFCNYTMPRKKKPRPYFDCYFNEGGTCNLTADEEEQLLRDKTARANTSNSNFSIDCPKYITDMTSRRRFRAAAMEYLFSNLNRVLVEAADVAAGEVFHYKVIPREKLITIHVR